jgi:hypothetical protein
MKKGKNTDKTPQNKTAPKNTENVVECCSVGALLYSNDNHKFPKFAK